MPKPLNWLSSMPDNKRKIITAAIPATQAEIAAAITVFLTESWITDKVLLTTMIAQASIALADSAAVTAAFNAKAE